MQKAKENDLKLSQLIPCVPTWLEATSVKHSLTDKEIEASEEWNILAPKTIVRKKCDYETWNVATVQRFVYPKNIVQNGGEEMSLPYKLFIGIIALAGVLGILGLISGTWSGLIIGLLCALFAWTMDQNKKK